MSKHKFDESVINDLMQMTYNADGFIKKGAVNITFELDVGLSSFTCSSTRLSFSSLLQRLN